MGKKLAIRGHSTRGKEVIKLLEMMGGSNIYQQDGEANTYSYYIYDNTILHDRLSITEDDDFEIFTLEEFLEKYPFKIGDKVIYTKFGDNCDDYPVTIESMKWTGTTIEYTFNDCVTCLAKDLKIWNGEPDTVISGIYLNSCDYADEVELNLGDYEIEVRDGRTYAVRKKPKYPKTYKECCKVLKKNPDIKPEIRMVSPEESLLFSKLIILKRCRDAYWKIAGEQMSLDKPWEPDWEHGKDKFYCICITEGEIVLGEWYIDNKILAFPTEKMRDAFYGNFKDLIEQCKELL